MKALWKTAVVSFFAACSLANASQTFHALSTIDPTVNAPAGGSGDSWAPIVSPDGRYVLFASTANNLLLSSNHTAMPASIPPLLNVFLRDRSNALTTLVSFNLAGTGGGNGNSFPVQLSTNGHFALFESSANDLVAGDTNNANDIFLRDLINGNTVLVSVDTNGFPANGPSRSSTMTPDGRYIAFVSAANNLVAGDTNFIDDVFVRDLQSNSTTLVSLGATARDTNFYYYSSEAPDITPDGRYVSFYSTTTNLVPEAPIGSDIYLRDLVAGSTIRVSAYARTVLTNNDVACFNHFMSVDGRFFAYEGTRSTSSIPPFAPSSFGWIFRYDRANDITTIVDTNGAVTAFRLPEIHSLDMTPDGRFITFIANTNGTGGSTTCVRLWDASAGTSMLVSGNVSGQVPDTSTCDWPVLDPSGRFVAFLSGPSNLTANAVIGDYHLYLRNTLAATTTLLDADTNGLGSPVTAMTIPRLTPNGRFVAFDCADANLIPDDRNRDSDVFLRDLTTGATELISAHEATLASRTANGPSFLSNGSVSADGRYLAFASEAENLVTNDSNGFPDVFVKDLVNRTTSLVSAATNGASGDGVSAEPVVTPDGRYVAFTSSADNLVTGDTNKTRDVFVRDLWSATTTLVSFNSLGTGVGNAASYSPSISPNGRFVLFLSKATNLTTNNIVIFANNENIFLRDLQLGTNYALTTRGGSVASMTRDGSSVMFLGDNGSSLSTNLYVWNTALASGTYTNKTQQISFAAINPAGTAVVFWNRFNLISSVFSVDMVGNTTNLIASGVTEGAKSAFRFSNDGRALVYVARLAGTNQIYLYDFQAGTTILISHNYNSPSAANGNSDSPVISANGRFIAYRSDSIDLVPEYTNGLPEIFLYDRQTGLNTLLSASRLGNSTPNNRSFSPVFSPDGTMLFFGSWTSDLVPGDFNHTSDLFSYGLLYVLPLPGNIGTQGPWLSWPWDSSMNYRVQYKQRLTDTWHDLGGAITNNGLKAYVQDPAPAGSQRFYRVVSF